MFRIHDLVENEDVEALEAALRAGISPDSPDDDFPEFLLIFRAIDISNEGRIRNFRNESDLRSIGLLLEFGCSLTASYKAETPYRFASSLGHLDAARLIERYTSQAPVGMD